MWCGVSPGRLHGLPEVVALLHVRDHRLLVAPHRAVHRVAERLLVLGVPDPLAAARAPHLVDVSRGCQRLATSVSASMMVCTVDGLWTSNQ
jgi:hypothetical protein